MWGTGVVRSAWVASIAATAVVLAGPASSVGRPPAERATPTFSSVETTRDRGTIAAAVAASQERHSPRHRFEPHALVHVPRPLAAHAHPAGRSRVIGTVAAASKYYHVPLVVWLEDLSRNRRWGLVEIPYAWPRREGWIRLAGLRRATTAVEVRVDLSRHWVTVYKRDHRLFGFKAATGAAVSPTPPGDYVVTDRVPFNRGGSLGSFAFGISGIQPHLPAGWSGGNQLAIHGTNNPASIGRSASAGCVRVSEAALARLRPLLRLGTPVLIVR
jgi:L,D-transpeptidase catalytic domain